MSMLKDWGINQPRKKNEDYERAINDARNLQNECDENIKQYKRENIIFLVVGIPVILFFLYFIWTLI